MREAASRELDQPYLYSGLEAWSYDLVDELTQFEDFGFYRMMLESCPGPVLDLGCGTGRILLRAEGAGARCRRFRFVAGNVMPMPAKAIGESVGSGAVYEGDIALSICSDPSRLF